MTDNKKLIDDARAFADRDNGLNWQGRIRELADALEAAEKAHTPTNDEREALDILLTHKKADVPAFNVCCTCGYRGTTVSKQGDFERHVAESLAAAGFRRSEVPEPSAEDRELIAQTMKDIGVKWGGPSMSEFAATPPLRKHYAIADALIAQGFHRGDHGERIDAWLMVADHEAFKDCYVEELPLIDSVLNRITALHDLASELQGEPSDAQEAVRRMKDAGVSAFTILGAVTKVFEMETKS